MRESRHGFALRDGREVYRVDEVDALRPFLMSVVSATDHWLFVSSTGGLTAGRVDADHALFPYETEDRLHPAAGRVGPVTLIRARGADGASRVWAPFAPPLEGDGARRALYKTLLGDRVTFEVIDEARGLTCAYSWSTGEQFGFIREARITRHEGREAIELELLDGLIGLLPAGIEAALQQSTSVLGDAYKQSELEAGSGIGIYALMARIVDKAEPAEALTATVAWQRGLPEPRITLDARAVPQFYRGAPIEEVDLIRGRPGAYLCAATLRLEGGASAEWVTVADVSRTQAQVVALSELLGSTTDVAAAVRRDAARGVEGLRRMLARADSQALSADARATAHHQANTLFNIMRGGVFADDLIPRDDLIDFLRVRNPAAAGRFIEALAHTLPERVAPSALRRAALESGDPDLARLCAEYMPLTFSRRHGDPSRPWNRFSIRVRDARGGARLDYEGNWRDIFQNWEALCLSFPDYLESALTVFVNASTADGFNPYRVTRAGIDWELPDPEDPWSNIGYWGDHQIIYLLKLLEATRDHHPQRLGALLEQRTFTYADVPYELAPYAAIVADPHNTITFNRSRQRRVLERVARIGEDGRLLHDRGGELTRVTLAEKLLVPLLSKLSNLVLEAGIWMNTQRPEWNDANNALVGYGVSLVTHAYLLRYARFMEALLEEVEAPTLRLSAEVATWLTAIREILARHAPELEDVEGLEARRRRLLDALGEAFSEYRARVYASGLSGAVELPTDEARRLLRLASTYLERGTRARRRAGGLYDAYNLLDLSTPRVARVARLPIMLEGQVAVLSTDALAPSEAADLIDGLFASPLYWPAQRSFLLYPRRVMPRFLDKNQLPEARINPLLEALLEWAPGRIVERDARGICRFAEAPRNARDLSAALDALAGEPQWAALVEAHREETLEAWEAVFDHRAFTGRSGTMVGYEGIGCIYWHMVSKLLLATQEQLMRARREGDAASAARLQAHYAQIRAGLSFEKTVEEYGAIPIDPYSHTAPDGGARQPGMTGQVKEELLTRRGELGVSVSGGRLRFDPASLPQGERLEEARAWGVIDVTGARRALTVPAGGLGFTVCGVAVTYAFGEGPTSTEIVYANGERRRVEGADLDAEVSRSIFRRAGEIVALEIRWAS